ncbi:(2Fe-2S)-binding protein [Methylocapsa acidiphila]|uniref:(2Fe-2S)-binding protein n=1 Tax=Methylocapsa acidiphila TaxID=133552 RepID=UPI0004215B14|nr:(2Fe-2S)-binding protein [Methylocapsa acidiphila]
MIVCSCHVLSDAKIRTALNGEACPRTPGAVYKCLGCSPSCGRCAATVRSIINEALTQAQSGETGRSGACDARAG